MTNNYYPKFEDGSSNTLLLDHSFYKECLEYAEAHNLNVLYTNTTSTGSVETIMAFKKKGYSCELYEVPQYAPDGLRLNDKIFCRFTR